MSSNAATNRLLFKTVSSLYGFAGAQAIPALHDAWPRLALSAVSLSATSEQGLTAIGWQLVKLARQAATARRMDVVRKASEAIIRLPVTDEIKTIGHFYGAVVEEHAGNVEHARLVLTQVACAPLSPCRARAILELGKTLFDAGQPASALPLYVEAARVAQEKDLVAAIRAQMMIAVVRSTDGDHHGALGDLDRLWPMVRLASYEHPALRYDYLNSLAVELAETGRVEEAKHAIGIALRSPFACRYPNWKATRDEIADKERSISYRPRIFSLAGPPPVSAATVPGTTLSELPQTRSSVDARVDPDSGIEQRSPSKTDPAIDSRTDAHPAAAPTASPAVMDPREESPRPVRRNPPDVLWAAAGYPKYSLARGPPATSIKL